MRLAPLAEGFGWLVAAVWLGMAIAGPGGALAYQRAHEELAAKRAEVVELRREVEKLRHEIALLRHDPVSIEIAIHRELGFVYPDEILVLRRPR